MEFSLPQRRSRKLTMQSRRYVSHDIILEILHRLPVKSLVRFTSVSKTWKASIESSSFISTHHRLHVETNTRSRDSRLMYIAIPLFKRDKDHCTLMPETVDQGVPARNIPLPRLFSTAYIRGSSEGLICFDLRSTSDLYIWNPFTRIMKRLPKGEIQCRRYNMSSHLGFGFAPRSGDHRVVRLVCGKESLLIEAEMYSLASDSWRRVKPASVSWESNWFIADFNYSIISFEGSIYWLVFARRCSNIDKILRFDLEEERFEVIKLGVNTMVGDNEFLHPYEYKFMVSDGFLVLLEYQRLLIERRRSIDLKGYIIKKSESGSSSWVATKTFELPIWARQGIALRADRRIADVGSSFFSNNILVRGVEGQLFAYEGYCDGKNLSFELRYLGVCNEELYEFSLIPLKETLFLLNKNGAKSEDHEG